MKRNPRVPGRKYRLTVHLYEDRRKVVRRVVFDALKDAVKAAKRLGKTRYGEIAVVSRRRKSKRAVWTSFKPKVSRRVLKRGKGETVRVPGGRGWEAVPEPEPERREPKRTRAGWNRKHKAKPVRPRAAEQIQTTAPEDYNRFMRLAKPRIVREKGDIVIRDAKGAEVLRFKAYRGAEKDWAELHEAGHGRISEKTAKRFKLKTLKGFEVERIDGTYGRVYYSKEIYRSRRGAVIGQAHGRPYIDKSGVKRNPKKYLGPMFEAMQPQNWIEGLWRSLPEYMRQKGDMSTWGLRVWVKDRSGRLEPVVTKFMRGTEDIHKLGTWIELLADLANRAGSKLGYGMSGIAARARVVSVEVLIGTAL